jgi:hypothetical protein
MAVQQKEVCVVVKDKKITNNAKPKELFELLVGDQRRHMHEVERHEIRLHFLCKRRKVRVTARDVQTLYPAVGGGVRGERRGQNEKIKCVQAKSYGQWGRGGA